MNNRWVFSLFFVLVLLLTAAGCTQPAAPPATPVPTAVETVATATPAPVATTIASSTPGPTQTLPGPWGIDIQVESNGFSPDPQIITTVRGGKGYSVIPQIDVTVTRADGKVETGVIRKPLKIGDSVSLPITSAMGNVNRVEVWATNPQGDKVKIFDDYVPFRTYN
ncbi:MAG: hypothetical protein Q7V05_14250 [Methanoregula sp.]|nr:hypothetical protein [Methanoregula sp.]